MDEKEAVIRLKNGQIDGLETLVQLYQVKALRAAFVICRNYAQAEDVVQAAFVRAYEQIEQFDAKRSFGPWFLKSVVNAALMVVTRHKQISLEAQTVEENKWLISTEPSLYERLEAAETKEAIWAALEQLSPGQRAAIILRYYLSLSDKEISEVLKCPPSTVRRRMHDARQRLRQLLPAWVRQS